ncbi:MAG TPA: ParB/RepB/Spo0J family partition protein [Candidatus Onthousia faecavium]|nr:ParB/RepB/Spo0J family partition protein [Candidatus Onthousia faecavium]
MENKRKALGRGLEELFSSEPLDIAKVEEEIINNTPKEQITEINLDELRSNPYQPRKNFDEESLQELASSIKTYGVFQPIIAKKSIKGYEIVAGERRVKASRLAGLKTIPAIIKDFTDEEMMELALLENLQRENLSALEEAEAYYKLKEKLNLTQEELAEKVGKSRSHITNMLGLLDLPAEIKDDIIKGDLSMGHARVLSKLENKEQALTLADKVIKENLSVRKLEELTSSPEEFHRKKEITKRKPLENEFSYLINDLEEKLDTKVRIKNNKLEISFINANDLNRLLEIMHLDK